MKQYWRIIGFVVTTGLCLNTYATDLMQVYQQALHSDPVFAQAQSTWESKKMNLPIAEAGYLTQVSLQANGDRDYLNQSGSITSGASTIADGILGSGNGNYSWQYGYGLTVTQPVFNFAVWSQIKGASATVKAATATYLSAQQSLMQRTATAYFNVLQAYDRLRYTIADRRAVWEQYVMAREQFRVGLIAITDEYEAKSQYDQVVAAQIAAENNLNIQLENLRAITNRQYASLKGLGRLPLLMPRPNNISAWVSVANRQNYAIKAQNYTVLAAMETIKQVAAGAYPSLNLQGTVGEAHAVDNPPNAVQDSATLGLLLSYNPIQGGAITASTKQARYNYVTASGALEQAHRQVVNQTRSSFLTVVSNISQIKADRQSILSARNALEATEAGFKVGTRTMVDVLNALTTLYKTQQQYAIDEYSYINNLIALKAAAGTLCVSDLEHINGWLGKSIRFPDQMNVAKIPTENNTRDIKVDDIYQDQLKSTNPKIERTSVRIHSVKTVQLAPPQSTVLPAPSRTA